jgi:hypothetical protein
MIPVLPPRSLRRAEARYAEAEAVLAVAAKDQKIKTTMVKAAVEADDQMIKPLFEFRSVPAA